MVGIFYLLGTPYAPASKIQSVKDQDSLSRSRINFPCKLEISFAPKETGFLMTSMLQNPYSTY